jgi:hypothetical protein
VKNRLLGEALAAIAWVTCGLACAHQEPEERAAPPRTPSPERAHRALDNNVGPALRPCPASFRGLSVHEVIAKHPAKNCLAIVGHLTATYAAGPICNAHPVSSGAGRKPTEDDQRCPREWALTDLADPIIVTDDQAREQPYISVSSPGPLEPGLQALLACNRDERGQSIMPARTRFVLPMGVMLGMRDLEQANSGLAGVTVGIFGWLYWNDRHGDMRVTHVCRVDGASDGAQPDG